MAEEGMFVSNRNVTVVTDYGYIIRFTKGEPVFVPPLAREAAVSYGVLPVNGELPLIEEAVRPVEPVGPERKRQLQKVVQLLIERNKVEDFTAGGVPKEKSMQKELGFRVARREINDAFKAVKIAESQQE